MEGHDAYARHMACIEATKAEIKKTQSQKAKKDLRRNLNQLYKDAAVYRRLRGMTNSK